MKILLIGPYFSNPNGDISLHNAEVGVYDAIKELGHEICVYDPRNKIFMFPVSEHLTKNCEDFNYKVDLVLCPGCGTNPKVFNTTFWKETKAIKVNWNSEPLRLIDYYNKLQWQKEQFDKFFTFDESEIDLYHQIGIKDIKWLPQAYNPKWYKSLNIKPTHDICFVGSTGGKWINRSFLIERISKSFKINVANNFNATIVNKVYNSHKLVINLGLYCPETGHPSEFIAFGIQQRQMEAIGAGCVVITNEIPLDTNKIFKDKYDMLFYNKRNLEEIIRYGLDNNNRNKIKENIIKIKDNHTYKARMLDFFATF